MKIIENLEVDINDVHPSPFNVHHAEKKSDKAFASLVDNIRENGLIQSISVRQAPETGGYVVIDGHRRLAALKTLGKKTVPVTVLDCDETTGMVATVNANEQRIPNDRILVAEQIGRLMDTGMTIKDIAASLSVSETTVSVWARLVKLVPEWRKFGKRYACTVDLLERVASFEPELQSEVAEAVGLNEYGEQDEDTTYGWSEFRWEFEHRLFRIESANFDVSACEGCAFNTGTQGVLFTRFGDDHHAQCEKKACFIAKYNARTDALIAKMKDAGTEVREVSSRWNIPGGVPTERKTKKNVQPYLFTDGELRKIMWGEQIEEVVREAKTPEQKAADAAIRKQKKSLNLAYARVRALPTFASESSEERDRLIDRIVCSDGFTDYIASYLKEKYAKACVYQIDEESIVEMVRMSGGVRMFAETFGCAFTDEEAEAVEKAVRSEN